MDLVQPHTTPEYPALVCDYLSAHYQFAFKEQATLGRIQKRPQCSVDQLADWGLRLTKKILGALG